MQENGRKLVLLSHCQHISLSPIIMLKNQEDLIGPHVRPTCVEVGRNEISRQASPTHPNAKGRLFPVPKGTVASGGG